MNYYSTNNRSLSVSLREAVMRGLAEDNGLYMPAKIPRLPKSFIAGLSAMSNQEIAMVITKTMIGDDLPDDVIQAIVDKTITFKVPLVKLEDQVWALELFHGPTLAFKDFGAQFMAALFGHFAESQSEEITILAATSGDTGSAVAHGFHN
ncbi:MAG: threonine synthase, partial [Cyclobacteriaceae bacterium]